MVPGGAYAYEVARSAWERYRQRCQDAEIRDEVQRLARAGFDEARRAAAEAAREAVVAGQEPAIELELYLSQVPAAVQQSLKRASDPAGTTVPSAFALASPEDVLQL